MGPGGCATGSNQHPDSILMTRKVESIEECYGLCKTKSKCAFFEYQTSQDSNSVNCQIHFWSDLDRGNGLDAYKCYRREDGK